MTARSRGRSTRTKKLGENEPSENANASRFGALLIEARSQLDAWTREAMEREVLGPLYAWSLLARVARKYWPAEYPIHAEFARRKLSAIQNPPKQVTRKLVAAEGVRGKAILDALMAAEFWYEKTKKREADLGRSSTREQAQIRGEFLARDSFELGLCLMDLGTIMNRVQKLKRAPGPLRKWACAAIQSLHTRNPTGPEPQASAVWRQIKDHPPAPDVRVEWPPKLGALMCWDKARHGGSGEITFKTFVNNLSKWSLLSPPHAAKDGSLEKRIR